ncbi:type III effector protein [Streptomyces sp. SDT5-1]|uniref:type III effector protein n=1 Tax=Streptomyces sp. SDT5-1 TaxID=3406418 RepID=UPI003FD0849F
MTTDDRGVPTAPASFLAADHALKSIEKSVRGAQAARPDTAAPDTDPAQALAALLLLRQLREQLAGWEPGLIETARDAGASWADLADPLGVASRQAAERRYLRLRPGAPGTTGEQRVQATRRRRASDRSQAAWARTNAAGLRTLAGQISALTDVPSPTRARLTEALGADDASALLPPLSDAHPYLDRHHAPLADRLSELLGGRTGDGGDEQRP